MLDDVAVSRYAARIRTGTMVGGAAPNYFVEELNTANGVFVNDVRVSGGRELPDGNLLSLGSHTLRLTQT
jgi:pSer/pThr/pTyr-binding forkhead associated (FHA) protein